MPQKADCWFSDDETDNYFLRVDITDLTLLSFLTHYGDSCFGIYNITLDAYLPYLPYESENEWFYKDIYEMEFHKKVLENALYVSDYNNEYELMTALETIRSRSNQVQKRVVIELLHRLEPASEGLEPGTHLFGYVDSVSTETNTESYEISVTATDIEHSHLMTVYNEDGSKQTYHIPVFPYESVVNYAQTTDLASWNELEDYECLDGKKISVSILCDGEYINISTDQMPEGGEHILAYLKSHFSDYMTEDYLTQ